MKMRFFLHSFSELCHIFSTRTEKTDFRKLWTEKDYEKRKNIFVRLQKYIDCIPKAEFDEFEEKSWKNFSNPALQFYDAAFDRILEEIPLTEPEEGSLVIWFLYNMGYIIKTPLTCFGVDIHHRKAVKLEKYLDFLAVTHNHNDHYSLPLMRKMTEKGKMVISNFFPAPGYTKYVQFTHSLPGVDIYCTQADHNHILKNFTMPMEFVCTSGEKKFVFFTSGDCTSSKFLHRKSEKIDLYAIHPRCGMKTADAVEQLSPQITFISHLQELGHEIDRYRWSFVEGDIALENCRSTGRNGYIPVWGEKFVWDGEKICFAM